MASLLEIISKPVSVSENPSEVFEMGKITITHFKVEKSSSSSPPKQLLIVTPTVKGSYPVILFTLGFCCLNTFYSQLLYLIASHGYIIVAPQLYTMFAQISGPTEIKYASKVISWLSTGLQSVLPEKVEPFLEKLSLVGHSRGGKAAFCLALGYESPSLKFSALIGIDPVAGNSFMRTKPEILNNEEKSFNISIPIAVIGTGLGGDKKLGSCPCAPDGYSHAEFFKESKPTRAHFVAADYGHMDMLDDKLSGIAGYMASIMCKNGKGSKDAMRRCCSGIIVAFLKAYLDNDKTYLSAINADPSIAPARLDHVQIDEESSAADASTFVKKKLGCCLLGLIFLMWAQAH